MVRRQTGSVEMWGSICPPPYMEKITDKVARTLYKYRLRNLIDVESQISIEAENSVYWK